MSTRLRSCELFTSYPACKWKITTVTVHAFRFRRAPHHFADKVWLYDYVWSVRRLNLLAFLTVLKCEDNTAPGVRGVLCFDSISVVSYPIVSYRTVSNECCESSCVHAR